MTVPRVAVIGAGAAAYGVLHALVHAEPRPSVTLISPGSRLTGPFETTQAPSTWPRDRWRDFYRTLRQMSGFRVIPAKTRFGAQPATRQVEGWGAIWQSHDLGGLTELWGLCSPRFDASDLRGWPISIDALDAHYEALAHDMGIAPGVSSPGSTRDALLTRPPIRNTALAEALHDRLLSTSSQRGAAYRFQPEPAPLAIETRAGHPNHCVGCGECMIGCYRQAMFSAADRIEAWLRGGQIARRIDATARVIQGATGQVTYETSPGHEGQECFDAVFVCAGTFASGEIALRSLEGLSALEITDNSAFSFPLMALQGVKGPRDDRHVALSNIIVTCHPREAELGPKAQVQIYPFFDHVWRSHLPQFIWPFLRSVGRLLRRRIMIGRIFLDGALSQSYRLTLDNEAKASLALARNPSSKLGWLPLLNDIRQLFRGCGLWLPTRAVLRQKTSSHYLGGLPIGGQHVDQDGCAGGRLYFCDGLTFASAPATSPTFTIMANARRVAIRWFDKLHRP